MDKIIPTLTVGLMQMTDTLDFEKITDEDLTIEGKDFFETDWLEHLI